MFEYGVAVGGPASKSGGGGGYGGGYSDFSQFVGAVGDNTTALYIGGAAAAFLFWVLFLR